MVVVCGVLLMINSVGTVVAGNPFFNQTIRAATTPSGANQPLINQQLYGFDGQLTDPESGYQFLGRGYHRAYNPVTRRFMSQDSMSPFSKGGFNGYIFARNNPIMHQDPSGHMSTNFWINIGAILGAIVGAVLAPFTGGSTAVIAAGEVAAAAGATSGALGAAGAATHNKALQKASLGLGIAGAAIDAVNIIGSGAKLVASSVNSASVVTLESRGISTTIGDTVENIGATGTIGRTFTSERSGLSTTVGDVIKRIDTPESIATDGERSAVENMTSNSSEVHYTGVADRASLTRLSDNEWSEASDVLDNFFKCETDSIGSNAMFRKDLFSDQENTIDNIISKNNFNKSESDDYTALHNIHESMRQYTNIPEEFYNKQTRIYFLESEERWPQNQVMDYWNTQ